MKTCSAFVLKVILLTRHGLGMGEVMSAKLLPGHPPWTGPDKLEAFSAEMCILRPLYLGDVEIRKTFFLQYLKLYLFIWLWERLT